MIPNIFGDFTFAISENLDMKEGLIVDILEGQLVITLNKDKAYRILEKRHLIVAALKKKLDELVEMKVSQLAKAEAEIEDGK